MLKVWCASPPVPQVSMVPSGAGTTMTRARIALTRPVSSSVVSPRMRMPMSSAAIWAGVPSPSSTWPQTASDSARASGVPETMPAMAVRMASVTLQGTFHGRHGPTPVPPGRKVGPSVVPPVFSTQRPHRPCAPSSGPGLAGPFAIVPRTGSQHRRLSVARVACRSPDTSTATHPGRRPSSLVRPSLGASPPERQACAAATCACARPRLPQRADTTPPR